MHQYDSDEPFTILIEPYIDRWRSLLKARIILGATRNTAAVTLLTASMINKQHKCEGQRAQALSQGHAFSNIHMLGNH